LLGLHKLREIEVQRCTLRTDSKVVTGQMEKECINRELTLERYLTLVKKWRTTSRVSPWNTSSDPKTPKLMNW
jgi:ribonuclease HI